MARAATLEALRAQIRALEGGARIQRRRAPSGLEALDSLIGGLPLPGILEITGVVGTGKVRVALEIAARTTRDRRTVAWVDPARRLHPPTALAMGVRLERLLIVRPPEDGTTSWPWATEQLLRSGCFQQVVVDLPPRSGSRRTLSHQWARAAEQGGCTAIVLGERPTRELPADVRLAVAGGRLTVCRDRSGRFGAARVLPDWPEGTLPWG